MFIRKIGVIALTLASVSVAGCATGSLNGFSRDGMQQVVTWKNPDYGPMTAEEYRHVSRHAQWCRNMAREQMSSPGESILTDAVGQGIAGMIGVGGGGSAAGAGAAGVLVPYGGAAGAATGAYGGASRWSGAMAGVVGTCTGTNLTDPRSRRPGVHATTSYVRTRNRGDQTPSWVTEAPADRGTPDPTETNEQGPEQRQQTPPR